MEPYPDWQDVGRRVELKAENGQTVQGELFVEDFFPDGSGGEVPMFAVRSEDGTEYGFSANKGWRFLDSIVADHGDLSKNPYPMCRCTVAEKK